MTVVGLVIQQHDGTILFQNVREYLSLDKLHLAAKAFKNQISSYDDTFITKGSISHLTGSVVVLNMYRVYYMILNELFILAISHANDNPFEGSVYLARAKRVLWTVSKDYTTSQINKKYTEVYFALERVLFGEDGVDVLSQKISEVTPHFNSFSNHHQHNNSVIATPTFINNSQPPPPITIGGRLIEPNTDDTITNNNTSNINNNNNININININQSIPLTLSTITQNNSNNNNNVTSSSSSSSSSSQNIISPNSSLNNNNINNINSNNNNQFNDIDTIYNKSQFESLMKLENSIIPDKIFTQIDQLPKVDKHIYDPPQTIKWGNPSVQSNSAGSTRVTNRIMFTLRHPNAGKEAKEKEKELELKEQQEINNMMLNRSNNISPPPSTPSASASGAGSASNKSSPSTSPLSTSYNNNNQSSPETSVVEQQQPQPSIVNNNDNGSGSTSPDTPDTPKRKFSLSMGTFNNKPTSLNSSTNGVVPDTTSSEAASSSASSAASPPPSVPITNSKTKMNFLNF